MDEKILSSGSRHGIHMEMKIRSAWEPSRRSRPFRRREIFSDMRERHREHEHADGFERLHRPRPGPRIMNRCMATRDQGEFPGKTAKKSARAGAPKPASCRLYGRRPLDGSQPCDGKRRPQGVDGEREGGGDFGGGAVGGGYGGLDFGMVDTSSPKGQVSTKAGQLHGMRYHAMKAAVARTDPGCPCPARSRQRGLAVRIRHEPA